MHSFISLVDRLTNHCSLMPSSCRNATPAKRSASACALPSPGNNHHHHHHHPSHNYAALAANTAGPLGGLSCSSSSFHQLSPNLDPTSSTSAAAIVAAANAALQPTPPPPPQPPTLSGISSPQPPRLTPGDYGGGGGFYSKSLFDRDTPAAASMLNLASRFRDSPIALVSVLS